MVHLFETINGGLKAGVYIKAVFTPLKIGSTEIYKNPMLITKINVLGRFVKFWVIFRYIWEEIVFFLKRVVKLRNIEDLVN